MHKHSPVLLVISAPSGAGKTTVCQHLLAANPQLTRAITCTTRSPREGERERIDYYFLDEAAFLQKIHAGDFLEHAQVYGNRYGTLRSEVMNKLRQDHDVLLTVDVQGVENLRAQARQEPDLQRALVTVFLTPPSLNVLAERLQRRNTDAEDVRQRRLSVARQEIAQSRHFDYVVISASVEEDVRRVAAILAAEQSRQTRVCAPVLD